MAADRPEENCLAPSGHTPPRVSHCYTDDDYFQSVDKRVEQTTESQLRLQPIDSIDRGILALMFARYRVLQLFAVSLAVGCAAAPKPAPASAPPPPPPSAADIIAAERGAKVHAVADPIEVDCEPGKSETCNALDDDCNGIIDDGCGYDSGGLQVTVAWNTAADIDLYVTDPSGDVIYYNEQHERSSLGGHLDHNARGDCRREQKHSRIENAYWPAPAPAGNYRIELHYFSPCASSAVTSAVVSVAFAGKLLGSYAYQLEPEQRLEALSLEVR